MTDSVLTFYESMAHEYDSLYGDWRAEVRRQGPILGALIRARAGADARRVLDATCGIGTQAIGLALAGFSVHASDLSPAAVERALREAAAFGVSLTGGAADLRALGLAVSGQFDAVIACDNALAHLFTDADLVAAFSQVRRRLRPGGVFLASIRDYDRLLAQVAEPQVTPVQQLPGEYDKGAGLPRATLPRVFDGAAGRRIVYQVWDWAADGKSYTIHQFFTYAEADGWRTSHYQTRFRALLRAEVDAALTTAGFTDIRWHAPEEGHFYQPVVTAKP